MKDVVDTTVVTVNFMIARPTYESSFVYSAKRTNSAHSEFIPDRYVK
jgi:hypothetical protein